MITSLGLTLTFLLPGITQGIPQFRTPMNPYFVPMPINNNPGMRASFPSIPVVYQKPNFFAEHEVGLLVLLGFFVVFILIVMSPKIFAFVRRSREKKKGSNVEQPPAKLDTESASKPPLKGILKKPTNILT